MRFEGWIFKCVYNEGCRKMVFVQYPNQRVAYALDDRLETHIHVHEEFGASTNPIAGGVFEIPTRRFVRGSYLFGQPADDVLNIIERYWEEIMDC